MTRQGDRDKETRTNEERMMIWAKFLSASKRTVARAAKVAGYRIVSSGRTTDGSYCYTLVADAANANSCTLKSMLIDAGAFDASWNYTD
jgi:hypothetical protein